ncbi:MAG TPA: hypothetical protein PKE26_13305 [Kiritimatiellia bacterium]|nr:hypothetical protein [Kiritimatiellia bacterium]HMP00078.1 hypothetical protein [Kiritimatiellia bacterium]HMP97538.1 hypothetical protein [Kiritimatiellia bacterium]
MKHDAEAEVLEPEVLPPSGNGKARTAESTGPGGISPVLAGLVVDIINIPLAGLPGFIAGGAVGYWAARYNGLSMPQALLVGMATGWYCGLPLPRTMPLATVVGLVLVLWRKWGP